EHDEKPALRSRRVVALAPGEIQIIVAGLVGSPSLPIGRKLRDFLRLPGFLDDDLALRLGPKPGFEVGVPIPGEQVVDLLAVSGFIRARAQASFTGLERAEAGRPPVVVIDAAVAPILPRNFQ